MDTTNRATLGFSFHVVKIMNAQELSWDNIFFLVFLDETKSIHLLDRNKLRQGMLYKHRCHNSLLGTLCASQL